MTAEEVVITLARRFEGLYLDPYFCPTGYRTVGYGHLYPVGGRITIAQAEAWLQQDVQVALAGAVRYCPVLELYPACHGAIADFCFNLGVGRLKASTLRRKINQQDWSAAQLELLKWVYGSGRKLPGLVLRRIAEASYFKELV